MTETPFQPKIDAGIDDHVQPMGRSSEGEVRSSDSFRPIFIVGAARSGTTMLAVMFDRHSRIAVPPETRFFFEYVPHMWPDGRPGSREEMVDRALAHEATGSLGLGREELLRQYSKYATDFPNLLRAMIEVYARKQGKVRQGEKSPNHIISVPLILKSFPTAKVICIYRDGRDSVLSMLRTPWMAENPRRFYLFCEHWIESIEYMFRWEKMFPPSQFTRVRYCDLVAEPERELRRLCGFVGEEFEFEQLDPETKSDVVLASEYDRRLKEKANKSVDNSRAGAWKTNATQDQIWALNSILGPTLRSLGYSDSSMSGCPLSRRVMLQIKRFPYLKPVRPFAHAAFRLKKRIFGGI